jgi:hypothetical protein
VGHVVGIAEPDRPGRGRPWAAQAEQPPDRQASELSLEVVERRVDAGPRRELFARQARLDLLERPRVVAQGVGVRLEVGERRLGRLPVTVDRRRLAEAGDAVVLDLDEDDLGGVLRAAGYDERLGQLERRDPGRELHKSRPYLPRNIEIEATLPPRKQHRSGGT